MAVDLPPPVTPQEVTAAQAQQGEAGATIPFQTYQIHVFGAPVLSADQLTAAVATADTLSNAVRAIASAAYAQGYPGVKTTYALAGSDLYLMLTLDGVTQVSADAPLGKYFEGLNGVAPLTDSALEPRRALASIHADRAGLDGTPTLKPAGDTGLNFELKPTAYGPDPTQVRAEFGNPGNRFVGRYFLDFDVRTGTQSGDELRAVTREGLKGMNDKRTDGEYFEQNLGWSRVGTWGLFGLGGRYLDFNYAPAAAAPRLNGGLWVGEAFWLYPILADFHSRLTTQLKVDRNSKTTELSADGQDTQRELYNSVEVSGSYIRTMDMGGRWDLELGLAVRKGLGQHDADTIAGTTVLQTTANLDYLLYRPAVRLKYYFTDDVTLGLDASAQITSDTVPEQQQWVMGGINNLAYALPGVAVGDSGYLGRAVLELGHYSIAGIEITPKAFAEYGQTRLENVAGGGKPTLGDGGGEIGVKLLSWLDGAAIYAAKFTDKGFAPGELEDAKANLYFRVQAKF